MKLFELQTDLTSYTYPVVKIFVCMSIIVFSFFRNRIFHISSLWMNEIVSILCFVLSITSILCIYISIGELFHTASNRRNTHYHRRPTDVKQLTIETITKLVSENDIIEIEVCTDVKTIVIGASSECKYSSSVFENKLFYISDSEYDTIEQFTEALNDLFPNRIIPVSKIDGLPLKYINLHPPAK